MERFSRALELEFELGEKFSSTVLRQGTRISRFTYLFCTGQSSKVDRWRVQNPNVAAVKPILPYASHEPAVQQALRLAQVSAATLGFHLSLPSQLVTVAGPVSVTCFSPTAYNPSLLHSLMKCAESG